MFAFETGSDSMRIGFGYDVHSLVEGRPLILGGVAIEWPRGLLGHSDADVLVHAACDALLGAAALGDIGRHFPDTDPRYQGISSLALLRETARLVRDRHYEIGNLDATVVCERPRLAPHIPQMIQNLAAASDVDPGRINIKATSTERLGFAGREEGIAAYAVVLLVKAALSSVGND